MDPLQILYALDAIAGMGGLFFKDNSAEKLLQLLRSYSDPSVVIGDTNKLFKMMVESPAYSTSLNDILAASSQAQSSTAANLADRGLTTSGIGAVASGVGSSLSGLNIGRLNADVFKQALERAMQLVQMRISGAAGLPAPRNIGAEIYGAGTNLLGDITKILANRNKVVGSTSVAGSMNNSVQTQATQDRVRKLIYGGSPQPYWLQRTGLQPMF